YMMLGDRITAEEAQKAGMIYKWFADKTFQKDSGLLALTLAGLPTRALAFTKEALNGSMSQDFEAQLHTEDLLQQKAALTEDFKEGVASFLEKRKPQFTGQ
ncbi:MAG: 2-(1,2-epoxy-1,2-dihydrophenyl)acetyl-CoA isomerase, partial [Bacteroidota bacterium]|nr:2-(1,2-epoxy-1,2-dihydrophenyl)acetyl-CoA isomerase [Bacteroidota bacterium]